MQQIKISELKPHPRNTEFFDDMSGDKWDEFLESIKTSGVIEPIVITQDKTIVSGHQRVRACKKLGITEVLADMRFYESEDRVLKDLLETNLRQRGTIGGSSIKEGRRIRELERLYGIQHGGDRSKTANGTALTQQDLVESGSISTSAASRLIVKLSPEEQEELIKLLPATEKYTQNQIQPYIDEIKLRDAGGTLDKQRIQELESKNAELEAKLNNTAPIIETVSVVPEDYESTKQQLSNYIKDYASLQSSYAKISNELLKYKQQARIQKENEPAEGFAKKLKDDVMYYCAAVAEFLRQKGGYVWISEYISELPEHERNAYIKATNEILSWAQNILNTINNGGE